MSGDEFIVVMPQVKLSDADQLLENWLRPRGISREQIETDLQQEVIRAPGGSETIYSIRRSKLQELLGEALDG